MKPLALIITALLALCLNLNASDAPYPDPIKSGGTAFETLKSLVGTWTGNKHDGDSVEPITIEYKLTSNGTAVMETIFKDTPMEMVTVYHGNGNKVEMTHYCSLGNQPKMRLAKNSSTTQLDFSFVSGANISDKNTAHMGDLTMKIPTKNRMTHYWGFYQNGKKARTVTMDLSRK